MNGLFIFLDRNSLYILTPCFLILSPTCYLDPQCGLFSTWGRYHNPVFNRCYQVAVTVILLLESYFP